MPVIPLGNNRFETVINRFDGGISNDPRDPRENVARMVSNYNIILNPRKMSPYRSVEDKNVNQATDTIRNFAVARFSATASRLYGLGRISSTDNRAEVLFKALTSGVANDLDDSDWSTMTNGSSATGILTHFDLFVFYRRNNRIYGARDGSQLWSVLADDSSAFEDTSDAADGNIAYTHIAQGLVHSKDDILYIPYYNDAAALGGRSRIASKNGSAAWTPSALSLPDHLVPVSICEYGNFIAIGCAPITGEGDSIVYLWDRNASLPTLSESINWGPDVLRILEYVDGELIGISQSGGATGAVQPVSGSVVAGGVSPRAASALQDRVIFRRLVGNRAEQFMEITRDSTDTDNVGNTVVPIAKQKINNRLFFLMLIEIDSVIRDGLWSVGKNQNGEWTLIHEQTTNNNTALTTGDVPENFIVIDDFRFITYRASGTWAMRGTNEGATAFAHNSDYITKRFNLGDSSMRKDLVEVTVTHEPLPANASVEVAYRINEETAFTTILTSDTDNDISRMAVNIESSGAALPKDYSEIQFRIRSTGGASGEGGEVTSLRFIEQMTARKP